MTFSDSDYGGTAVGSLLRIHLLPRIRLGRRLVLSGRQPRDSATSVFTALRCSLDWTFHVRRRQLRLRGAPLVSEATRVSRRAFSDPERSLRRSRAPEEILRDR